MSLPEFRIECYELYNVPIMDLGHPLKRWHQTRNSLNLRALSSLGSPTTRLIILDFRLLRIIRGLMSLLIKPFSFGGCRTPSCSSSKSRVSIFCIKSRAHRLEDSDSLLGLHVDSECLCRTEDVSNLAGLSTDLENVEAI